MTTNTNADWKCGDEFLLYHPDASHVDPAYRDGWNDCYRAALNTAAAAAAVPAAQAADSVMEDAARWQALPAFFEEYQIDALKLYRDIDAYLAAARKQGAPHD